MRKKRFRLLKVTKTRSFVFLTRTSAAVVWKHLNETHMAASRLTSNFGVTMLDFGTMLGDCALKTSPPGSIINKFFLQKKILFDFAQNFRSFCFVSETFKSGVFFANSV